MYVQSTWSIQNAVQVSAHGQITQLGSDTQLINSYGIDSPPTIYSSN